MPTWETINRQLAKFAAQLEREIALEPAECSKVASLLAADIRFLPDSVKDEIVAASPVPIEVRLEELVAFQAWMDVARSLKTNRVVRGVVTRAQVVVQNYVCFVYLKDACFEVLALRATPGSVARRCASYLSQGTLRDFRNAFSHGNWRYNPDFTGIQCWVLEDARRRDGQMRSFEVSQNQLGFWQTLARCVANVTYVELAGGR